MRVRALVLDADAVDTLDSALIEEAWFDHFGLPPDIHKIKRVVCDGIVYLLSKSCSDDARLLVIRVDDSKAFSGGRRARYPFERMLRVALHHFRPEVAIPIQWQAFHQGSLVSVYADNITKQSGLRLYFDQDPHGAGSGHIYAYAAEEGSRKFSEVPKDMGVYDIALRNFVEAALTEPETGSKAGDYGILLSEPLGAQLSGAASLSEWYNKKVTAQQKDFIDRPLNAPVRLRGAAGTGKTQSIAIKCLRELIRFEALGEPARLAVITHSSGLAHDVIRGMLYAMDQGEGWSKFKNAKLWLGTLYELAQDLLQYERKGLQPLSADGREGREYQRMLISSSIDYLERSSQFMLDLKHRCSVDFQSLFSPDSRDQFVEELMNEFACVIDAENIQKGTAEAETYLKTSRESWQYPLNEADRRVVLDIHERYSDLLRNENYLSMDQMIADFNRYLMTHEWRQLRDKNGFDVIFVDEYHYFNRAEAVALHHLFKTTASQEGKLPLFMAYDLKQGPDDVSLSHGSKGMLNFMATRAGKSELVELTEVFRFTPEIADFMKDLDGAFPAMDLEGEWKPYVGSSKTENGDIPELWKLPTNQSLVDSVFAAAKSRASDLKEGGRQVAVLCMNERQFDQYQNAGRIKDSFVAITARDQMNELKYAKKKCVFSMPEFVAGLQFDTVFLIHVDEAELSDGARGSGFQRRFVSRCYVGASRAAAHLIIATSHERGGPSSILAGPLSRGSLVEKKPGNL